MESLFSYLSVNWVSVLVLGLLILIGILISVRDDSQRIAQSTVAAVYRVAIKTAADFQDEALMWLRSPAGIDYRKRLIIAAYHNLPEKIGPLPTGIVRKWLTAEKFAEYVEGAFETAVLLAEQVDDPLKRPIKK